MKVLRFPVQCTAVDANAHFKMCRAIAGLVRAFSATPSDVTEFTQKDLMIALLEQVKEELSVTDEDVRRHKERWS